MEIVGRRWFLMVPWCSAPCPSPSSSSSASQAAPYWTAGGSLSRFHGPGMIQNVWQIDKSPNPIMDGINFLSYLVCFNGKSRILKWRYVSTIFWAIFCSWNGHWFYTSNSLHVSGFLQNDLKKIRRWLTSAALFTTPSPNFSQLLRARQQLQGPVRSLPRSQLAWTTVFPPPLDGSWLPKSNQRSFQCLTCAGKSIIVLPVIKDRNWKSPSERQRRSH